MLAQFAEPLWGVKFSLEQYPRMPVAGWVMLGLGLLVFVLTFAVRGMKFSGLLTALALLLYYPAVYALYVYVYNAFDPESLKVPGPLLMALADQNTLYGVERGLLISLGVLAGLFFVCVLESAINYRRLPHKDRPADEEDKPFVEVAAVPPPLPATARPAPARRPVPQKAARPPAPPNTAKNPFDFS
jgi:hypothetical protein